MTYTRLDDFQEAESAYCPWLTFCVFAWVRFTVAVFSGSDAFLFRPPLDASLLHPFLVLQDSDGSTPLGFADSDTEVRTLRSPFGKLGRHIF